MQFLIYVLVEEYIVSYSAKLITFLIIRFKTLYRYSMKSTIILYIRLIANVKFLIFAWIHKSYNNEAIICV